MEQQQVICYQLSLFDENGQPKHIRPSEGREHVKGAEAGQAFQVGRAGEQERALAERSLMEQVCSHDNIRRAYKQVKQNKGVCGIDGMSVNEFATWYIENETILIQSLLSGKYKPQPVKQVEIPKPDGGVRKLGIPTVIDRVIQQAISQVLSPIYEKEFSVHSYGFRPNRSAHQALAEASQYVENGHTIVVDIDLKNFFDKVNHDRLMHRLSERISDRILLGLTRKYLQSGIMTGGVMSQRTEGTPQGSPLSPLLSNIVLDELDKELEKRGHTFVRYADDCNIFVRSQKAGERVMQSLCNFIEGRLKLQVNLDKSQVCQVNQSKFLGYTIQKSGMLTIAGKSLKRLKAKIRELTRRNRGRSLDQVISELSQKLAGWMQYFQYAQCKRLLQELDSWIRRKLRCYRMKQCKRVFTLQQFLERSGVKSWHSWILALSGKGLWRKSGTPQAHQAMGVNWFDERGLYNLTLNYERLNNLRKPPCARACTVV